jgi:hypothetical protein
LWWIGVVCASRVGSPLIISFFIVMWLVLYGVFFFHFFDVTWVMNGKVIDLLACWKGQRGNKMVWEVWRIAPLCLMWIIWRERNFRCFEDKELTTAKISTRFLTLLYQMGGCFEHSSSFFDISICRFLFSFFSLKRCLCTLPVY